MSKRRAHRVLRGGSHYFNYWSLRTTSGFPAKSKSLNGRIGFRIVVKRREL